MSPNVLHRRAQRAEALADRGLRIWENAGGPSLGRGCANLAAYRYRDRAHEAEAEAERLRERLAELADGWDGNPHEGGPEAWDVLGACARDVRQLLDEELDRG